MSHYKRGADSVSSPPAKRKLRQSSILNSFRPVSQETTPAIQSLSNHEEKEVIVLDAEARSTAAPVSTAANPSVCVEEQSHGMDDEYTPPLFSSQDDASAAAAAVELQSDFDSDASTPSSQTRPPGTVIPCSSGTPLRSCPPCVTDPGNLVKPRSCTFLFNKRDIERNDKRPPRPWPTTYEDRWDSHHVRLPCSPQNLVVLGKGDARNQQSRWKVIEDALSKPMQNSWDIEEAILSYNPHYSQRWSFQGLHQFFDATGSSGGADRAERALYLLQTIPAMARLVLSLPHVLPAGVPLLERSQNCTLALSQLQIACLLANAFFCTFPRRNSSGRGTEYSSYPSINFSTLFQGDYGRKTLHPRRAAKFRCVFHYFQCVTTNVPNGVVSFERRVLTDGVEWDSCTDTLGEIHMCDDGTIEDDGQGMLQADFANKFIGGGVLSRGCVQEEIRLLICPEMLVSRLFCEVMSDKECVVMVGAERFSSYSGYSDSFRWTGPYKDNTPFDEWRRRHTSVVAFDALVFNDKPSQFRATPLLREVNKAYCAFLSPATVAPSERAAVATGNWGCGAFGGDAYLKAVLQLIAASAAGRQLLYFTFGNARLSQDILFLHQAMHANGVTVSELWNAIRGYGTAPNSSAGGRHLYSYLHHHLCSGSSETDSMSAASSVGPVSPARDGSDTEDGLSLATLANSSRPDQSPDNNPAACDMDSVSDSASAATAPDPVPQVHLDEDTLSTADTALSSKDAACSKSHEPHTEKETGEESLTLPYED